MTLSKRGTQYISKSGRLSSGHRTGKGQSSSQLPRRVVLKNVLNIGQLQSFPMLVRSCLKSCMLQLGRLQSMGLQRVRHDWMTKHSTWLQQYVNQELADIQTGFRKGSGIRDQIANIHWITEKAREFWKNIYLCFINYTKAFDCVNHKEQWKVLKRWEYETILSVSWETCMQIKKQQLELCMEQLIGSWMREEYDRDVCCHPVYLTYMPSTSREMPSWMNYKLESR